MAKLRDLDLTNMDFWPFMELFLDVFRIDLDYFERKFYSYLR